MQFHTVVPSFKNLILFVMFSLSGKFYLWVVVEGICTVQGWMDAVLHPANQSEVDRRNLAHTVVIHSWTDALSHLSSGLIGQLSSRSSWIKMKTDGLLHRSSPAPANIILCLIINQSVRALER